MTTRPRTTRSDTELSALFEFSQVVNSSLDLTVILDSVLLTLMGKLLVSKSAVLLRTGKRTFAVMTGKGVPKNLLQESLTLPSVANRVLQVGAGHPEPLRTAGITMLFPIAVRGEVTGYFGIAQHPLRPVTGEQRRFAATLISIAATAIEKGHSYSEVRSVNRSLDEKVHQLRTLFELAKEFGGVLDRDRLLKMFSLTLMGQVGTSRYALCMKEGGGVFSKVSPEYLQNDIALIIPLVKAPIRTADLPATKRFRTLREHLAKERIAALIPLQIQSEARGVLCIGERIRGGGYSDSDLEFVYSLANLAFVSLENSRLFTEAVEKKRLEGELQVAKEIQQGLLPRSLPDIPGFDIAAVNISSKQVGGDYYDVIPTEDDTFIIVIADVSGKGTPASLLMANVQATVHALVPFGLPLPAATARINDLIYRNTASDKFITFFWGVLDPRRRTFRYVNAGHNPPFVVRQDGRVDRLTDGGLILGIMNTIVPYSEGVVPLSPGDSVVLFTDGVSEAMNAAGEDYTEERLETFVASRRSLPAATLVDDIRHEVQRHAAGAPQSDDITIVAFTAV